MAEIVNLRHARKRARKAVAERQAAENRTVHGLSKADRAARLVETRRADLILDGARRTSIPAAVPETEE